jgi:hypothetical protein
VRGGIIHHKHKPTTPESKIAQPFHQIYQHRGCHRGGGNPTLGWPNQMFNLLHLKRESICQPALA